MKIYTRTGDGGETGLLGGHRVPKHHPAIATCGELDESNAAIGFALACGVASPLKEQLQQVQQDLFVLGSHVAASAGTARSLPALPSGAVSQLEGWIDACEACLEPMTAFILPGGSQAGAALHLARTVCRRSERSLTGLLSVAVNADDLRDCLVYLNRLADFLFVAARLANHTAQQPETKWLPQTPPRQAGSAAGPEAGS